MKSLLITLCLVSSFAINLVAQNCGCEGLLKYEISDRQTLEQVQIDYLQTITSENYSEKKKNLSGSVFAIVPTPVDISGNYENFDKSRKRFFQNIQYSENRFFSETDFQQKMNNLGLTFFNDCIAICSENDGIYAKLTYNTCEYANITVQSFISLKPFIKIEIKNLRNGVIKNLDEFNKTKFNNKSKFPLQIDRKNKDQDITFQLYSDNQIVKEVIIPAKCRKGICNNKNWAFAYLDYITLKEYNKPIDAIYDYYKKIFSDINEDGNIDIIYMGPQKTFIHYSDIDCQCLFKTRQEEEFGPADMYKNYNRSIEDKNNDKHLDIVYTRADGKLIYYYRGDGKGNFNSERVEINR